LCYEVEASFSSILREISFFPLDELGSPSAVNSTFLSFRIRDKKAASTRCAMKKASAPSILVAMMLLAVAVIAEAQQTRSVTRIGYLSSVNPANESARAEGIRLALHERGYIEGQNIAIEYRYGEGKIDRYPELANELVRLKNDIIVVAGGIHLIRATKNATKTIPIVMVGAGNDPVEAGLIESLARPGANVTGLTNLVGKLGGKRLELLKEAVPDRSPASPRSHSRPVWLGC
jgi:ABC-type uncharacterized transport system substrate-binding protein